MYALVFNGREIHVAARSGRLRAACQTRVKWLSSVVAPILTVLRCVVNGGGLVNLGYSNWAKFVRHFNYAIRPAPASGDRHNSDRASA